MRQPALRPVERVALAGLFAALAAAGGFALVAVPNVELVTLVVFLSGYLYGARLGAVVGAVGEGIFSGANPLGPAPPPLFVGQVLGMALAGVLGGIAGRMAQTARIEADLDAREPRAHRRLLAAAFFGAAGVVATAVYHLSTDALYAASAGLTWRVVAAGVPFYAVHLVSNAAVFALAGPLVARAARASLGSARRAAP